MSSVDAPDYKDRIYRVLIVDDDVALATGIRRAFETQGYVVRMLHRGTSVIEATAAFKPDVILLDVMMPEMDGWEVLSRLRADEHSREVPVVMLTAAESVSAKVKGFTLGADDYVTKPFSVHELRCRVGAILRRCKPDPDDSRVCRIPVVVGGSRLDFTCCRDVYYIEGVRNFTYVHTAGSRFLSRLTLGAVEGREIEGFRRVHRSFIVNMDHVNGCGWASKSSYRLHLSDADATEIPVSRTLIPEIQRELGLRP